MNFNFSNLFLKKPEVATIPSPLKDEVKLNRDAYIEKIKQIRHDIRSPLSSLQAAYRLLDKKEKVSQSIASAIRRIEILVDDLNQIDKKVETSKLVIAEITLQESVFALSNSFEQSKNAVLKYSSLQHDLTPVYASEADFRNVIENLLKNSLDAIDQNGTVDVTINTNHGECVINIDDDGCGISPENINLLFSKGASFGKKESGLGLSLYHGKNTIESFGGTLKYFPLAKGTRFQIRLPLLQTGVTFASLPSEKSIKVIDDDSTTALILSQVGYSITESAKTFEAGQRLLGSIQSPDEVCIVDNRLNNNKRGTTLIAEQSHRKNIYLCTNDYDCMDLINQAKAIGVKIIPKPLIFLRRMQSIYFN